MKALRDLERQWKKSNGGQGNAVTDADTLSVYEFKLENDVETEQECFIKTIQSLNPRSVQLQQNPSRDRLAFQKSASNKNSSGVSGAQSKRKPQYKGKQFGTDQCESLSKLANVIKHQFMSLHEKQARIRSKSAFKYHKPKEPP